MHSMRARYGVNRSSFLATTVILYTTHAEYAVRHDFQ